MNFLVKNKIPHSIMYSNVIELQIANDDILLEQHIKKNPSNAQYTSKFSINMLLDALYTWLDRKLTLSL